MRAHTLLFSVALVAVVASQALGDNIWARRSTRYGYLFQDNLARNIGDVLTILVLENTSINQREQRQLTKATDTSNEFNYQGASASDNGGRTGSANLQLNNTSNRNFQGNAQLTSGRTYTDRMGVTVVDILPNGVLVIEGHRVRNVSGERRILKVTGFVRPADLAPDNTILSTSVANFTIEYTGRGVDSQFVNQGWLGRFFNIIWPF